MSPNIASPARRSLLAGMASLSVLALAGCKTMSMDSAEANPEPTISQYYLSMYGAVPDERFPIPAVNLRQLQPAYWRTVVQDPTGERPGTIVVSTSERYLYLVQEGGQAIRYGIGVGREGFAWSGRAEVGRKAQWPVWTPPPEMIIRQPEVAPYRNGMAPGLDNPLGARALYIYQNGRDSGYRLHGNPDETSIGNAVSSGCVRLLNQDVIDLYNRAPVGTKILVA